MKKTQFKHNLSKVKRQRENERNVLNNLFKDYTKTLINITNQKK
jgi:hypothetical protein